MPRNYTVNPKAAKLFNIMHALYEKLLFKNMQCKTAEPRSDIAERLGSKMLKCLRFKFPL